MKRNLFLHFGMVAFTVLLLTGCPSPDPDVGGSTSQTPTTADFNISGTGTFTHDGNPKTVTVTAKDGKTTGTITVKYNGNATAPSAAGTYTVTFDVAAATGWNAASGLTAGTLVISDGSVSGTQITSVSIAIPAPAKDAVPATTASASGAVNYTIGTVTWSPNDNPYQGGKVYTASVTLTAESGYTFTGLTTATVNTQTANITNNTGSSVTLSYAFPATDTRTVMALGIQFQPTKMSYNQEDKLNLAGLIIQIIYTDSSSEYVIAANFATKNITASPANGDALSVTANNGKPVTISYGSHTVDTGSLTVTPIAPVLSDFTVSGLTQDYDGNPKTVTVTAKEGKTTGTVTVKYNGNTAAPTNAGTYPVTFDVAADTNYTAANNFSAGTLTIKPIPTADDFTVTGLSHAYDGNPKTVTVTAKNGITGMGTVTVKYDGNTTTPTVGTYAVTVDVTDGANYAAVSGLSVGTLNIYFASVADLGTWLSGQPANTATAPYAVKLNVSDLGGDSYTAGSAGYVLHQNNTKYVSLDLSGSTFTSIGDTAFSGCASLTGVTIGNSVTSIGDIAFFDCTSLSAIYVDSGNTAYSSTDGVLYNKSKTTLITYPAGKAGSTFTIPNGVSSIGSSAFLFCTSLTGVTIPSGVNNIGQSAFSFCTSLTGITIPDSVTSIGAYAFDRCSSLAAFDVDSANSSYSSVDGVLYNKNKTTLVTYPPGKTGSTFTIPNSVTSIGNSAFYYCTSLTGVTIPNGVTSIGMQAFDSCTSLADITIPNSVTSIDQLAFSSCTSLASVIIGNKVASIGYSAFSSCTSLASVTFVGTIPSSGFNANAFNGLGDLRAKFYATNSTNGTAGTYTTTAPVSSSSTWTKQN